MRRTVLFALSLLMLCLAIWWSRGQSADLRMSATWREVEPGILRSTGLPCGYALVHEDAALLIGAARNVDWRGLRALGINKIERCLLTHHHRDSSALAAELIGAGVVVQAPKATSDWLSPEGVRQFWKACLPEIEAGREPGLRERTFNTFAYLVPPRGVDGIDFSLDDGQEFDWHGWHLKAMSTPGHSRDHMSFAAYRSANQDARPIIFCGDAFSTRGKLWSPYTTDWDHWTDLGLKAAADSLRKLAKLDSRRLCPEHGPIVAEDIAGTLEQTAQAADEVGFLKSFERFSKQRLGGEPRYEFLAKEQVATAGEKPWAKLSPHLFLTGNTYVLRSDAGPILLVDPFGANLAEQVRRLQQEEQLGPLEVVLITHAHNDHYVGLHRLPNRETFEVWTLDEVARPIGEPFGRTAFGLDARAIRTDRWLKADESVTWHEFSFRPRHFPGQTYFTMGLLTTIDGHRSFFTGDNFFHADQFSGSGGWSGRNRGWPDLYARSAQAVLDAAPSWVLAEHGGAFEFNAEDFQRRLRWGQAAAKAADAVSPSGRFRRDWNPSRIQVEPLLIQTSAGQPAKATVVIENLLDQPERLSLKLDSNSIASPWHRDIEVAPHETVRLDLPLAISEKAPRGRSVIPLIVTSGGVEDGGDTFVVVEIP